MNQSTTLPIVHVAAGILFRPDGYFLLASRPSGKIKAGFWEFPGGKLASHETPYEALVRELAEELNIRVTVAMPWIVRTVTYPHAMVCLHFFQVTKWEGEPYPCENQQFYWQDPDQNSLPLVLPANEPILRSLMVPQCLAFSNIAELGESEFLCRLQNKISVLKSLKNHDKCDNSLVSKNVTWMPFWLVLREPQLGQSAYYQLARKVISLVRQQEIREIRILLHNEPHFALELGADGVHFSSQILSSMQHRPQGMNWIGASVHTEEELVFSSSLGMDYAVLGSVTATRSHPDGPLLGWDGFARTMHTGWPLPVFAIGGMKLEDILTVRMRGGHGIASLRAFWET